jgi:hypothetical protein
MKLASLLCQWAVLLALFPVFFLLCVLSYKPRTKYVIGEWWD